MTQEDHIKKIEGDIAALKDRNSRVESDKAWETSNFRVASITGLTYIIAAVFLFLLGVPNFWLSALVPTLGFFLSTQSLPFIKKWWVRNHYVH